VRGWRRAGLRAVCVAPIAVAVLLAAPVSAGAFTLFESPSGNIGCVISKSGARCDIRERSWQPPPKPASCQTDWGYGLTVGRRGRGRFICAGDSVLGGKRRLAYGKTIRRGRFRCRSRTNGMRCVNRRNGHGFALSRQFARRF
jgi:hypothetical protein